MAEHRAGLAAQEAKQKASSKKPGGKPPAPPVQGSLPTDQINRRRVVVIADAYDEFTYANLNEAFRLIEQSADFFALATNRSFRDADGELSLDVGGFVACLEYASNRKAHVLGKPSPDFFRSVVAHMGLAPTNTVMIGDDAEFDVSAAINAGLRGILVRTGKYRPGAEDGVDPKPDAVPKTFWKPSILF